MIPVCTARAADCTLLLSEHHITYCLDQTAQIDEATSQASLHTKVCIGLAGRNYQVEVAVRHCNAAKCQPLQTTIDHSMSALPKSNIALTGDEL